MTKNYPSSFSFTQQSISSPYIHTPHTYIYMFMFINIYSVVLYTILIILLYRYIVCKDYVNTCLINSINNNWKI